MFPFQNKGDSAGAVINITHPSVPSEDLPALLSDLATEVSSRKKEKVKMLPENFQRN